MRSSGQDPSPPAAVTGVGFCPPACAPLSARLACPGSLRRPAAPGPQEEGVPPALPLLVAPRLGLSWVALTGPCVRSAGSRRVFPRPGPPPPGQVGHEQGSWPRPAQPLGAECCEECAPSAGKGQSWGLVLGGCGCTPGAWSWVTEARRARPRLGDLSPSASAGSCSRKGPSRPGVPLGQTGLQAVPPSLVLGCQPTGSWEIGRASCRERVSSPV